MKKEELQKLVNKSIAVGQEVKDAVKQTLIDMGATSKENGLWFDFLNGSAPCYPSCNFGEDLADSYITKIWNDRGLIKANVHAYYVGEEVEDIDLADEPNVDYTDILDYLISELD